jgi:hypothetical protein
MDNAKSKFHYYYFPKLFLISHKLLGIFFNSSNKTPALKQNIPLFHKKFPLAISPRNLIWFSLKESTLSPSLSMYPYPVSGFVGTIPKDYKKTILCFIDSFLH